MKGIILAGGNGTRLYPLTASISKHLLPINDKPMIYYPLSVLMLAGIKEILIISRSRDLEAYKTLFRDGDFLGISISYAIQDHASGIAQAFQIGEQFICNSPVCLILGDNIFYGHGLTDYLKKALEEPSGATIFAYHVNDPTGFGIVDFDENGKVASVEEKPLNPRSNYAVTGLYIYENSVIKYSKSIKPSTRNELEITAINQIYLTKQELKVTVLGRGIAWLDTGTHEALLSAGQFFQSIETRQGLKAACIEEIAMLNGWISLDDFSALAHKAPNSNYGNYLKRLARDVREA